MSMNGREPSDFKFSGGEDEQSALLQRTRKNRRVAKSGNRATAFFIVLLLVLGGLFAFAYMDIRKRVAQLEETGERNVQEMVAEMEAQVSLVTGRYDQLQKSLTEEVFPMDEIFLALESSTSALKDQLNTIDAQVAALETTQAEKADKSALEKAVAEMTDALPPINERVNGLASRIEAAEADSAAKLAAHEERLAALSAAVREYVDAAVQARQAADESLSTLNREIADLKTEMSALTSVAIDQKTLEKALNSQRAALGKRIDALSGGVDRNAKTLRSIQNKVNAVEQTAEAAARALRESPPKTIQAPPQPGTFLEQDIQ